MFHPPPTPALLQGNSVTILSNYKHQIYTKPHVSFMMLERISFTPVCFVFDMADTDAEPASSPEKDLL